MVEIVDVQTGICQYSTYFLLEADTLYWKSTKLYQVSTKNHCQQWYPWQLKLTITDHWSRKLCKLYWQWNVVVLLYTAFLSLLFFYVELFCCTCSTHNSILWFYKKNINYFPSNLTKHEGFNDNSFDWKFYCMLLVNLSIKISSRLTIFNMH